MKVTIRALFVALCAVSFARGQDLLRFHANLGFGQALEVLEDIDGDGVLDWALVGSVYVAPTAYYTVAMHSGANAAVLATAMTNVPTLETWWPPQLARIGDVDSDGFSDVVFAFYGRADLFSSATGALLSTCVSPAFDNTLGTSVAVLGDLDGDGVGDLALGYPRHRIVQTGPFQHAIFNGPGRVDIFSGATGALLRSIVETPPGSALGTGFGARVVNLGDYDGDGVDDVLTSNGVEPYGLYANYVAALSGATGVVLFRMSLQTPYSTSFQADGELAALGDVDADGVPDFAVAEPSLRRVRIFSGASLSVRSTTSGGPYAMRYATNLRSLRDFDGDGARDLGLGMPQYQLAPSGFTPQSLTPRGWAQIVSGADGSVLWTRVGFADNEHFGADLELVDDFDGDGRPEVITNCADPASATLSNGLGVFSSRTGYALPTTYCAGVAHLAWSGSISLAANDFTLELQRASPGWTANFFAGSRQTGGWLGATPCVMGPGVRLGPPILTDANGKATRAILPANFVPFAAGTTWYFQSSHALRSSPDTPERFSDALAVTFTP